MLISLLHNLDKLVISNTYSLKNGVSYFQTKELLYGHLNLHRTDTGEGARVHSIGRALAAHFPDFRLTLEQARGSRFRIGLKFQSKALHMTPSGAWDQAHSLVRGLLAISVDESEPSASAPGPWSLEELDLHADVQGCRFGPDTPFRFVSNGTDLRTLVYRGRELRTFYIGRQLAVYNKSREIEEHPKKAYVRDLWHGLDPAADVWRLEFRLNSGDHPGLLTGDVDLNGIWRECLRRVRLPWGRRRGAPKDPLWKLLGGLKFEAPWPEGFWRVPGGPSDIASVLPETPAPAGLEAVVASDGVDEFPC